MGLRGSARVSLRLGAGRGRPLISIIINSNLLVAAQRGACRVSLSLDARQAMRAVAWTDFDPIIKSSINYTGTVPAAGFRRSDATQLSESPSVRENCMFLQRLFDVFRRLFCFSRILILQIHLFPLLLLF